jgi:YVTN family beta-propeller protein
MSMATDGGMIRTSKVRRRARDKLVMNTDERPSFGSLLKRYRGVAGLTQEELAERAALSARAVSDLERGVNTRPRPYTVHQLAEALRLSPDDRVAFESAAIPAAVAPAPEDTLAWGNCLGALPFRDLIGREDERERIRSILGTIAAGTGQVVFFMGEMGAGKTRLLQQVMVEALERGFLILSGRCHATDEGTPYYPFVEALRGLVARSPARVSPEIQRRWKKLQGLMTAVSDTSGAVAAKAVAQQDISLAVRDLLLLGAKEAPLALLLDDVQWADSSSLKLLQQLARTTNGSRILLAGAFRDLRLTEEHPDLAHTLQTLSRERLAERITVRRLSLEETTTLVGATMGQDEVSEAFASFVYRRTKGVPRLIDQLVRSLGGRLELQGEIGAGAMGRVFRAFDRTTEQMVAAKLVLARQEIDLDTLLRFQQEGAVLSTLDHPHIVDIYDTFAEEHASCIIMELLDGRSLGKILQDGPLPLARAKNLIQQVAVALSYAHSQGIVHRDIKPDNVMVLEDDQVKVTDFGIARILQPDTSLQTIATTGMRMGTPLYMAPEQIEGKKIDARTDIYALGAMLYHMVTGKPPFEGNDALAVAVKHLQEEPVPPSQVNPAIPADWDALILKAMAKDPSKRFQSTRDMEEALGSLGEQAARRLLPAARPRRIAAMVGMMILVLAVLSGVWVHVATSSQQASVGSRLDAYLSGLAAHQQLGGTVLVARKGHILVDKGYGLADRKDGVPNSPITKYPVGGVNFSASLLAALKLEEQGELKDEVHVCSYLSSCPKSWKPITIRMVLDGTSGLPTANSGQAGHTTAQTLASCEATPLTALLGAGLNYQNCAVVVLGTIFEKVTGEPWESVMQQLIFRPAGMRESGRVTNQLRPPAWAREYSGSNPGQGNVYQNDYFQIYSTAKDIDAYDAALFGGRLVSQGTLQRMLAPRDPVVPPDAGIANARSGYKWRIGTVFGHRVIYTTGNTWSFTTANFYLPQDDVTIAVISNDDQNDVEAIAVHLVDLVVGKRGVSHVDPAQAIAATIKVPGAFAHTGSDGAVWVPRPSDGSVARIDPATNKVAARVPIGGQNWGWVASGSGQVWAPDQANETVARINPATNQVMASVPVGIKPFGTAIEGNTLWVDNSFEDPGVTNTIVRIDLQTQKAVATLTNADTNVGQPFLQLAASPDALWFADWATGTIKRLDATTNKVVASIHAGLQPSSVAVGDGAIWTSNHYSNLVTRIDPATNKVVANIPLNGYPTSARIDGDCCGGNIAVGAGAVWTIAGSGLRTLVRIDPLTNEVTASLTFPQGFVGPIAIADGSLWVQSGDRLYRIDPRTMQ